MSGSREKKRRGEKCVCVGGWGVERREELSECVEVERRRGEE